MPKTVTAAVVTSYNEMELRDYPYPKIGADEGILRVELAGVCSSDPGWFHGKMDLPGFPIILGHEIFGVIEEVGDAAALAWGVQPGDRVVVEGSTRCDRCWYCHTGQYHLCDNRRSYGSTIPVTVPPALWGAYSQYLYLAPGSMVHRVSDRVTDEDAVVICAVLANGVRWARDIGRIRQGESIVIQGVGPQGLAALIAAKECGAGLIVATGLTMDQRRFELARQYGADRIVNVEEEPLQDVVLGLTNGRGADVVMDLTGNPKAIVPALDFVRKQGRFVQCGVTGTKTLTPMPLDKLLFKEIALFGVFAHEVNSVLGALKIAESKKYDIGAMVTHKFKLEDALAAVRHAGREVPGEDPVKVVLTPTK